MKIITNEKPTEVQFGALDSGDVFKWAGEYFLKTTFEGEAVRLEDGVLDDFPPECEVRLVEAILTIS